MTKIVHGLVGLPITAAGRRIVKRWEREDRADRALGQRVNLPRVSTRPQMVPTSAVAHEPISFAIGLTALLTSAGLGAAAPIIGGVIVSVHCTIRFSAHDRD
jgi:hypothetical protein